MSLPHHHALREAGDLEEMKLKEAAKVVRKGYAENLTYTRFPLEHWKRKYRS